MDKLLSYNFYPVFKTVFNHLDLETLVSCYNVSEEFRQMVVNMLLKNKEKYKVQNNREIWLQFFKIEFSDGWYDLTNFRREKYSKEFIYTFKEYLIKFDHLFELIDYKTLTEEFLEENIDYVCLIKASIHTKLSENFIRKYKDKVDWEMICKYQTLSIDFIKEHKDKVAWKMLIDYDKIPTKYFQSMMYQYKEEIEFDDMFWYIQYNIMEFKPNDYFY